MTLAELRTEIESGPLAAELAADYKAGRDVGVADRLNAKTSRGYVPIEMVAAYCCERGITGGVMALLEIPLGADIAPGVSMSVQIKGMLHTVMTLVQLDYRLEWVDVDKAAFGQACDGCIGLGVMSAENKADILAMAEGRSSRAEAAFGWQSVVTPLQVEAARKGNS